MKAADDFIGNRLKNGANFIILFLKRFDEHSSSDFVL